MNGRRLSGWQRLGVLISILWVILAPTTAVYLYSQSGTEQAWLAYSVCSRAKLNATDCDAEVRKNLRVLTTPDWGGVAFIAVAPIPVFWLAGWLTITSVRWVRRGFVGDQKSS